MLKRLFWVIIGFFMFLCAACAKDESDVDLNSEFVTETEKESENIGSVEEIIPEGIVYSELSLDTLVSDDKMKSKVLQLILDEKQLIDTIESECEIDSNDAYEVDGISYYRVVEADSWDYYVDIAKQYYSEDVLEKFTSKYMVESKLFLEANGKLYRAMADGISGTIYEESIEIWQIEENMYYVTILAHTVGGDNHYNGYMIQVSEDNDYDFEIVDRIIVY